MKKILLPATFLVAACCPKSAVKPVPFAHGGNAAWINSVVDLTPEAVHAQLGAPVTTDADSPGGAEECFAVTAPIARRCVVYVQGKVLFDNVDAVVPAAQLVETYRHTVKHEGATLGKPDVERHYTFTPGVHVLGLWGNRGFRFGESCVLESALKEAEANGASQLALDSDAVANAAKAGTVCLRADWHKGASVYSHGLGGDLPADASYLMTIHRHSLDPVRTGAYQDAMDKDVKGFMNELEDFEKKVNESLDEEKADPAGEKAAE